MKDDSRRFLFVGSKPLGLAALRALHEAVPGRIAGVVTCDDTKDGRSVLEEFGQVCRELDLPLDVLSKPSELEEVVTSRAPYCVLVIGWYWLIAERVLSLAPAGFFGVHASLLPKNRGNAPLVWAVLLGQKETGVTLFSFDSGVDSGDIIGQLQFSIGRADTIADVLERAESSIVELVGAHAGPLLDGIAHRTVQNDDNATYLSLRRPEDGEIDWTKPARELHDFVRAQTRPYPGAFTFLPDGRLLRVWSATVFPRPYHGIPGLVGPAEGDGVVVTCGDGALILQEVDAQDESGARESVRLKWAMRLGRSSDAMRGSAKSR